MPTTQITFGFMKNIAHSLFIIGLLTIILGILVFIYPELLGMIVGIGLIIIGLVSISTAATINKRSQIKIPS